MNAQSRSWFMRGILVIFVASAAAFGQALVSVPVAEAACGALPSDKGQVTFTVSVPSTGTYRFWAHLYSPSAGNNAMYLQIDQTTCQVTVGNATIPAGAFTWVDYQNGSTANKINASLSSGNHTVILAGLDPSVGVDKVLLLSDTACIPTGDGSNCTNSTSTPTPTGGGGTTPTPSATIVVTPAPGATPVPGGGTAVSGVITLPKPTTAGTTRTYILDGKPVSSATIDTTKLSDGTHTLEVVDKDASGKTTTTSQKLIVKNAKGWLTMVLGWVKQPLNAGLAALAVLMIGGGALWFFKLRMRPHLTPDSVLTPTAFPTAPPAGVILPDDTHKTE